MKLLCCVILICFTLACSSQAKSSFIVEDRKGHTIEFSSFRYCTGGNFWDTCRGDVELTVTKGSIEITKIIPRDFEGIQSIEILEGSGENLSAFTKEVRNAEFRLVYEELDEIVGLEKSEAKIERLREEAQKRWEAEHGKKSTQTLTSRTSETQLKYRESKKQELTDRINAIQDSLKELKIRVTYASGEVVEGIRKRNDWQNEDYIYGASKDSHKEVRLDIAKIKSIKVKTNE